jgi:hypothetical protein
MKLYGAIYQRHSSSRPPLYDPPPSQLKPDNRFLPCVWRKPQNSSGLLQMNLGMLKERRGFAVIRCKYLPTSEHSHVLDGWFSITATVEPIKHFRVSRSGACVDERWRCCTLGGHLYRYRHPTVAVKWLPLLPRIRESPVSYLGPNLVILNEAFYCILKTNDRRTEH